MQGHSPDDLHFRSHTCGTNSLYTIKIFQLQKLNLSQDTEALHQFSYKTTSSSLQTKSAWDFLDLKILSKYLPPERISLDRRPPRIPLIECNWLLQVSAFRNYLIGWRRLPGLYWPKGLTPIPRNRRGPCRDRLNVLDKLLDRLTWICNYILTRGDEAIWACAITLVPKPLYYPKNPEMNVNKCLNL